MKPIVKTFLKVVFAFIAAFVVTIVAALCLPSCNVTRKITTQSEYIQRGDTNVVIVTKTIESYDATKKIGVGTY